MNCKALHPLCEVPRLCATAWRAGGLGARSTSWNTWDASGGSCGAKGLWAQGTVVACWTHRVRGVRGAGEQGLRSRGGWGPGPHTARLSFPRNWEQQSLTSQKLSVVSSEASEASS